MTPTQKLLEELDDLPDDLREYIAADFLRGCLAALLEALLRGAGEEP